jgi:hypothetical protein
MLLSFCSRITDVQTSEGLDLFEKLSAHLPDEHVIADLVIAVSFSCLVSLGGKCSSEVQDVASPRNETDGSSKKETTLIMSGGEGYVDFRTGSNNTGKREDNFRGKV